LIAEDVPENWLTVYVGDDATDEDAFEVVEPEGVGVLVGADPETAASVRVAKQSAVAEFLELVAAHAVTEYSVTHDYGLRRNSPEERDIGAARRNPFPAIPQGRYWGCFAGESVPSTWRSTTDRRPSK
jgi:hypothetical protein